MSGDAMLGLVVNKPAPAKGRNAPSNEEGNAMLAATDLMEIHQKLKEQTESMGLSSSFSGCSSILANLKNQIWDLETQALHNLLEEQLASKLRSILKGAEKQQTKTSKCMEEFEKRMKALSQKVEEEVQQLSALGHELAESLNTEVKPEKLMTAISTDPSSVVETVVSNLKSVFTEWQINTSTFFHRVSRLADDEIEAIIAIVDGAGAEEEIVSSEGVQSRLRETELEIQTGIKEIERRIMAQVNDIVSGLYEQARNMSSSSIAVADDLMDLLQSSVNDLQINFSEDEDDFTSMLKNLFFFLTPFLLAGVSCGRRSVHPREELPEEKRGKELLEEYPSWRQLTLPFQFLARRPLVGSFVTLLFFVMSLWTLSASYFLINKESTDEHGNETPMLEPQYSKWVDNGVAMRHVLFYGAFATIPCMLLVGCKLLINNAHLPGCGLLMAQLEEHYGVRLSSIPQVQQRMGSKAPAQIEVPCELGPAENLWRIDKAIARRCRSNFILNLVISVAGMIVTLMNFFVFAGYDVRPFLFVHCAAALVTVFLAIPVAFGCVNVLCTSADLLRYNIVAYGQLLDMVCLRAALVIKQRKAAILGAHAESDASDQPGSQASMTAAQEVEHAVAKDQLLAELRQQLARRERMLLRTSKRMIAGDVGRSANTLAALVLLCYFVLLFYVALDFLTLQSQGELAQSAWFYSIGIVLGIGASIFAIIQPLFAMAKQAQEWNKLVRGCKGSLRSEVAAVLSANRDPASLFRHHDSFQDEFTWTILGLKMTYGSIATFVCTYATLLFSVVVVPNIAGAVDKIKEMAEEQAAAA